MPVKPTPQLPPPPQPQSAFAGQPDYELSPEAQTYLSMIQKFPGTYMQTGSGHRFGTSPLGYPEVTLPFTVGRTGFANLGATMAAPDAARQQVYELPPGIEELLRTYYRNDPAVVYSQNPDPQTIAHERIHVGQRLSGYPTTGNEGILQRLLVNAQQRGLVPQGVDPSKSSREPPAYGFSNPQNYSPEDFAAYMDDVHMRAPRPWGLEASMPQAEMEKYLKTHPVPYNKKPPIKMKEVK